MCSHERPKNNITHKTSKIPLVLLDIVFNIMINQYFSNSSQNTKCKSTLSMKKESQYNADFFFFFKVLNYETHLVSSTEHHGYCFYYNECLQ